MAVSRKQWPSRTAGMALCTAIVHETTRRRRQFMLFRQDCEESSRSKGKIRIRGLAFEGQRHNRYVHAACAQLSRSNLGVISSTMVTRACGNFGESRQDARQKIGSDGGDHADGQDRPAIGRLCSGPHRLSAHFRVRGTRPARAEETLCRLRETDRAAKPVEQARAELIFKFQDLLGSDGCATWHCCAARLNARLGDGAEVTELMEFHRALPPVLRISEPQPAAIGCAYPLYAKYILDV